METQVEYQIRGEHGYMGSCYQNRKEAEDALNEGPNPDPTFGELYIEEVETRKPQMLKLELTKEEGQTLFELLDVAVKAGGVQVAKAALPIVDKLMEAAKQVSDSNPQ